MTLPTLGPKPIFPPGRTVAFSLEVRDAGNVLVAASGVTLTLYPPDASGAPRAGTPINVTPIANPSTGVYTAEYVCSVSGSWGSRWAYSTPKVDALEGEFIVSRSVALP